LNALASPKYPALAAILVALEPITIWGFAYRYPLVEIKDLRQFAGEAIRAEA
jgi:hypothetical protein